MKRILFTLLCFLLLLTAVSAQVWLDYSFSGGVSSQWGIDIDEGLSRHGFINQADSQLDLKLSLDPEIYSRNGTNWSAELNLTGLELIMGNDLGVILWEGNVYTVDTNGNSTETPGPESATNPLYDYTIIQSNFAVRMPEISAKMLYNNRLYMSVSANPNFNYNWVTIDDDEDWPDLVGVEGQHSGGLGLGVESDIFDWDLQFTSKEAGTDNAWYNYAAGTELTVKAEDLLKLQAYYAYTQSYGDDDTYQADQNMGIRLDTDLGSALELSTVFEASVASGAPLIMEGSIELPWQVKDHIILTISSGYVNDSVMVLTSNKVSAEILGDLSFLFSLQEYNMKAFDINVPFLEAVLESAYKIPLSKGRYIKPGMSASYNFNLIKADQAMLYPDPNGIDVLVSGDKDDQLSCETYLELLLVPNTLINMTYKSDQLMPGMDSQAFAFDKGSFTFTTEIRF